MAKNNTENTKLRGTLPTGEIVVIVRLGKKNARVRMPDAPKSESVIVPVSDLTDIRKIEPTPKSVPVEQPESEVEAQIDETLASDQVANA